MLLLYQLFICKFVVPKTDQSISVVHILVNQKTFSSVRFNLFYLREAWLQLCTRFFLYFSHMVVF